MGKFTQDGCDIRFNISALLRTLDPCNILIDLVGGTTNNIRTNDSVILVSSDGSEVYVEVDGIISDDSIIKCISGSTEYQCFIPVDLPYRDLRVLISSSTSTIGVIRNTVVLSQDTIFKIQSEDNGFRILPSVRISNSSIAVRGKSTIKSPSASDLPSKIHTGDIGGGGVSQVWRNDLPSSENAHIVNWGFARNIVAEPQIKYTGKECADQYYQVCWVTLPTHARSTYIGWQDFIKKYNLFSDIPWRVFEVEGPNGVHLIDASVQILWDEVENTDIDITVPWYIPGAKDVSVYVPWGDFTQVDFVFEVDWLSPDYRDVTYSIVWGPVDWSKICCVKYFPPKACSLITFDTKEPAVKDVCQGIVLSVGPKYDKAISKYCPYRHVHSGVRDPFDHLEELKDYILEPREEYDMINTVTVQVLPLNSDLPPVEVYTIDINTDKSSYLWSFSMTVGKDESSKSFLDMVKPRVVNNNIVYTDVLININQNFWVCRVEGYTESRTFGKDTWQINGRSPSMELGSPQNKKFTYTYNNPDNDKTAGAQIIEEMLQGIRLGIDNSGWEPVFDRYGDKIHTGFNPSGADDWGFRNNSLSWQNVTQIEAITSLTESIGAFIITEPNSIGAGLPPDVLNSGQQNFKKLYIRPKYNYPPWHWKETSDHWSYIFGRDNQGKWLPGNKLISTELSMDVGRSNENKADYNAVMVMGTLESQNYENENGNGFPVVELYRSGVGPEFRVYAPDIVDEKLQSAPACIEAGRAILCETGFWLKHTLKMYSLKYPNSTDDTLPPLCWPGDFVQVQEHNRIGKREKIWHGDVEAVQVSVAVNNGAVYVTQTLGINEYVG